MDKYVNQEELNQWCNNIDFMTMEEITHYRQDDFFDDEEFIKECDAFWYRLNIIDKRFYYEQYN